MSDKTTNEKMACWHDAHAASFPEGSEWRKFHESSAADLRARSCSLASCQEWKETKMMNLKLIEDQPRWRVAIVALFAKLMGVLIHVEGYPFGSGRSRKRFPPEEMGQTPAHSGQIIGGHAGPTP